MVSTGTEQFSLNGRAAVVTGAGTGLGEAMAIGLAEAGADVAGVYHNHPPDRAKGEIERLGRRFVSVQADLSTIEPVNRVVEAAVEAFGRLDILVNNAGIIRRAPSLEFTEKDWDDVMDVNLKSVFFLCQAAARQFVKQSSGGKIINIASMLSFQGGILIPPYTASKSGVRGLTQLLANEWAARGINVNAIAPGYMATSNTEPLRTDPKRAPGILARIPAGRWGLPDDLKGAVVFLASDASAYVNGFTLAVDGGWLGR
jgi:2-deoxy-D-gluconate 3-dehydrogenase